MQIFTYPMNNGWRLLRPLCVLIALLLGYGASWAATIVDADNQVIYEIVDEENQLVEIYKQQAMGSYYDVLTIPATVTQLNTEDTDHYGKTYTVVGMQPGAFQYAGITGCIIEADIPIIPENAFSYCSSLASITLPPNIYKVGKYAFRSCYSLKKIEFTDKLELIDSYAFQYCSAMTEADLSNCSNLYQISESAFYGCSKLAFPELNVGDGLEIQQYAFASCKALGTVTLPKNCYLFNNAFESANISELNLPAEGNNIFRTQKDANSYYYLATQAFQYATLPEEIVIPSNIDYLPKELFNNGKSLKTVVFQSEDAELASSCFRYISSLKNLIWPAKIKAIGDNCFANTGLENITIPPCTTLGSMSFANNYYLTQINFPETEIGNLKDKVFYNCSELTHVELPDWMTDIQSYWFQDCSSLKTVKWPANLKNIWASAFENTALELEYDEANPEKYSFPSTLESIMFYAFKNVYTLGPVSFPPSIKFIGMQSFRDCTSLQIPNFGELPNLKTVDQGAFMNCTAISGTVTTPPNLEKLGTDDVFNCGGGTFRDKLSNGVFQDCTGLTKIKLNSGVSIGVDCFCQSGLQEIEWPEGPDAKVTLKNGAFRFAGHLKSVTIPGYVNISDEAFYWCDSLTNVKMLDGIIRTGDRAFMNCSRLQFVTLSPSIEEISDASFAYTLISTIHSFPETLTKIGQFAFWRGQNSGTLRLHKNIEFIGQGAFIGNEYTNIVWPDFTEEEIAERLRRPDFELYHWPIKINGDVFANNKFENIVLPSWMKIVPAGLFRQETDKDAYKYYVGSWFWPYSGTAKNYEDRSEFLRSITFPEGVTAIGDKAFYCNTMLKIGSFPSTITDYGAGCFFKGGWKLTTEDVEQEDGSTVKEEQYLGTLICPDGTDFGGTAFAYAKIDKIIFDGCATFHDAAFAGMRCITEIEFPECMTQIPEGFCSEWTKLKKVRFKGNKITDINKGAFEKCTLLDDFPDFKNLPELKYIGDNAFNQSTLLFKDLDLSFNNNLYYIGDFAFSRIQSLETVKFPEVESLKLGKNSFYNDKKLQAVHIPKSVPEIPDGCFAWCEGLTSVTFEPRTDSKVMNIKPYAFLRAKMDKIKFPDVGLNIGRGAFWLCSALEDIEWPESENRSVSLGVRTFYMCSKLNLKELHPSTRTVPDSCFFQTTSLKSLRMPGVYTIGSRAFQASYIEEVRLDNNVNQFLSIGSYAFKNCSYLKHFSSRIAPGNIYTEAFYNCPYLEDFIVDDTETQKCKYAYPRIFFKCVRLNKVSDFFDGFVGEAKQSCFWDCASLKNIAIPAYCDQLNSSTTYSSNTSTEAAKTPHPYIASRFYYCKKLQSIDFNAGFNVKLSTYDYNYNDNTPLKGVSYVHPAIVNGILNPFEVTKLAPYYTNNSNIANNQTYPNPPSRSGDPIKLLVPRATKYKFVEADFEQPNVDGNKYFDVREIKDPVFDLHGEIHSKFIPGEDKNDYTAIIRWQLELSDLDETDTTELDIYRDDTLAARIFLGKPELITTGINDGSVITSEPTYAVTYRAEDAAGNDVTERLIWDDFYFENPTKPGYFSHIVQTAQSKVYFHGESTARIGQVTALGRTSWFLYKDRFESPLLSNFDVKTEYTYTIHLKNYKYKEWANTDDYEADTETGLYWKWAEKRTGEESKDWLVSNPCKLYTSVAKPSIAIDGMYSRQDVENDRHPVRSQRLDPTTVPENADYALSYLIEGGSEMHRNQDNNNYIIQNVRTYKLAGRKDAITDHTLWGDVKDINGQNTGVLTGPDYQVKPNETHFQTVTYAGYRGSFGSPKVSLFGAPALEIKGKYDGNPNRHVHWDKNTAVLQYSIEFQPILEKFGYEKLEQLKENNYFIGLWRVVETIPGTYSPALYADDETSNFTTETLLWHSDGLQPQENYDGCDECQKVGYDHSTMTYTDRVPLQVPVISSNVKYVARLYVQKPDDATQYALAEAETPMLDAGIHTGIERPFDNVSAAQLQEILENGKLYNLQGVSIKRPAKGDIFVAIHAERIYKLRMP